MLNSQVHFSGKGRLFNQS